MATIEVRNLYKIFGPRAVSRALPLVKAGKSKSDVLEETGCTVGINDASFSIERGEVFVIMGLSGSGKSTVLRCINRLIEPTAGEVLLDGENLVAYGKEKLRETRRHRMAMVFQHFGLLPHRSVIDNVAYGLEVQGFSKEQRYTQARKAIELVGLSEYAGQMTQQLSGGMQQRVGLARALATDADILLMDEAFSALDPLIRNQMQDELLDLQASVHKTIVFITHDLDEALKVGDHIAIMKDGRIEQIGTPEQILTRPGSEYVRSFVENVDRTKVITAGTIMQQPGAWLRLRDGTARAARLMREQGRSTLYVVDAERTLQGLVSIDDCLAAQRRDEHDLKPLLKTDVPTAGPETTISDLLTLAAETTIPIAVVDENRRMQGIIPRAALLSAIAGEEVSRG